MKFHYDVVIIGGGPASLAAAIKLHRLGVTRIVLFERNVCLGGILPQCIHSGFGLKYYQENLTGPEYASRLVNEFLKLGIEYYTGAMVIDLAKNKEVIVSSRSFGIRKIQAKTIIIATGCRERTRENLEITGTRPAGIYTAGQAQRLININGFSIGSSVVIQGSGDVGLIMARRLIIEGYTVAAVFECLPYLSGCLRNKVQCLDDFNIPLILNHEITEIEGHHRVEGVYVQPIYPLLGKKKFYKCDTVLFSVGLISEGDLLKEIDKLQPGIFVCGNARIVHELADDASAEGEYMAEVVVDFLKVKKLIGNKKILPVKKMNINYNADFFQKMRRKKCLVCSVCPKSCVLFNVSDGCKKGQEFYIKSKGKRVQHVTTTLNICFQGHKKRVSVRTIEPINVAQVLRIKSILKKIKRLSKTNFQIECGDQYISMMITGVY